MVEQTSKPEKKIVTRVYINEEGNIVVTEMWEELAEEMVGESCELN